MCIGADPNGNKASSCYFNGKIYSTRVYDRALTEEEIQHNYESEKVRYGIGKEDLPENNEKIDYIESTGTQYIITDIIPTDTMGVYAKISSSNISGDLTYFGSRKSTDTRFWVFNYSNKLGFGWNTNTPSENRPTLTKNEIFEIEYNYKNSRKTKYKENEIDSLNNTLSTSNTIPIAIFAGNDNGNISNKSSIKIYEFKISNELEIIHDFFPVFNTITNSVGLYDEIDQKFYGNSGTGNFNSSIGKFANISDDGGYKCDSDGIVETGITITGNYKIETEIKMDSFPSSYNNIWGTGSSSFESWIPSSGKTLCFRSNSTRCESSKTMKLGEKYTIVEEVKGGKLTADVNGENWLTKSVSSGTSSKTLKIFATTSNTCATNMTMYYFRIYIEDELVLDLVPVKYGETIDGVVMSQAGLYDKVTKSFK